MRPGNRGLHALSDRNGRVLKYAGARVGVYGRGCAQVRQGGAGHAAIHYLSPFFPLFVVLPILVTIADAENEHVVVRINLVEEQVETALSSVLVRPASARKVCRWRSRTGAQYLLFRYPKRGDRFSGRTVCPRHHRSNPMTSSEPRQSLTQRLKDWESPYPTAPATAQEAH